MTVYSFADVVATIDGRPVQGLWEGDDAIQIEDMEDFASAIEGVDGDVLVSIGAGDTKRITLRLMQTSPTHRWLMNRIATIRAGRTVPFAMSIRDTRTGEGGSSAKCMILTRPTQSYGRNAEAREWTIVAAAWNENAVSYN